MKQITGVAGYAVWEGIRWMWVFFRRRRHLYERQLLNDGPAKDKLGRVWKRGLMVVVLLALALAGGLFLLQSVGPYNRLRREALHQVGVARLQEWAVSILDNPPSQFAPAGPQGCLRAENIPADIRKLASSCWIVYEPEDTKAGLREHILFACGGGFYHYGLVVGRAGYEPAAKKQFHYEKLDDGVWGLYER